MADLKNIGTPAPKLENNKPEKKTWLRLVRRHEPLGPLTKRAGRSDVLRVDVVTDGEVVASIGALIDVGVELPIDGAVGLRLQTLHFEETWEYPS